MPLNCNLFLIMAALIGAATVPAHAGTLAGSGRVTQDATLAASVPALGRMRDLGRAPQTLPVSLGVTLAYRHAAELQQLIEMQSDPRSRYYHRFLSNAEFASYFGPTVLEERRVVTSLERAGFRVVHRYANRTLVDVVAPATLAERYFHTEVHRVVQPDTTVRYANVTPAILPAELQGAVAAVTGFTNVTYVHTTLAFPTGQRKIAAKARALALLGTNQTSRVGTRVEGFRAPTALNAKITTATATVNELRDPSFESGKLGTWLPCTSVSATNPTVSTILAHTGKFSAYMGSTSLHTGEIDPNAGVCQAVTIPTSGVLTFWVDQFSNEPNTTNAYQEADLLDSTGKRIVNLYNTVNRKPYWTELAYDLSNFAGGRYYLYFGVHGNGNKTYETNQFVDDVSLTGTAYPAATGVRLGPPFLGPDDGYGPAVVADAYDLLVQHGYAGAGHATGVAISGDYSDTDLRTYLRYFGITRGGSTTRVAVDGGAPFDPSPTSGSSEATLDVETIVSLAPSTQLYMYLFPDLSSQHIEDGYNQAVSDNAVDVMNSSFGGCETSDLTFDNAVATIIAQGAAKGITFAASSGDDGSAACDGDTGVNSPASSPNVVAVGGTSLYVNEDASYNSEYAWDGSGGGVSLVWGLQPSQRIPGVIGKSRNVPDIAFPADPYTGTAFYFAGVWQGPLGGTSWAAPIYSALQTEINQRRVSRAGYVNPRIYAAYTKYGLAAFHDITSGNNGAYSAHAGYDDVTGLGSLRGAYFSGVE